jgi:hypothetical protein
MPLIFVEFAQVRNDWNEKMSGGFISFWTGDAPLFCDTHGQLIEDNRRHSFQIAKESEDRIGVAVMSASNDTPDYGVFGSISAAADAIKVFCEDCLGAHSQEVINDLVAIGLLLDQGVSELLEDIESELQINVEDAIKPNRSPVGAIYIEARSFDIEVSAGSEGYLFDETDLDERAEEEDFVDLKCLAWTP